MWNDLFISGVPLAEKAVRTVLVYLFLLIGLRLAGKRELSQLNSFDLVVLLLLSTTHNFYVALVCMAIGGWGMLLYFSTTNTLIQTSVADGMRGRVMGIWALVFDQTVAGKHVPSPVYSMSVWQKKDGKWVVAAHSEATAADAK